MVGHLAISDMYIAFKEKVKGFHYLADLEREGYVDGLIYNKIGDMYWYGRGCPQDALKWNEYHRRAVDHGYVRAYQTLFASWERLGQLDRAEEVFIESEKYLMDETKIMTWHINRLCSQSYTPNIESLKGFTSPIVKALYYCDILIQRGSPSGYILKSSIYKEGKGGMAKDEGKAVRIREEADRRGLATHSFYTSGGLIAAYKYVSYIIQSLPLSPSISLSLHIYSSIYIYLYMYRLSYLVCIYIYSIYIIEHIYMLYIYISCI